MLRIYLISILTATFIAVIICLCISLSKPKESFTGDPPQSGDVLLADKNGSLTTYSLQNLITFVEGNIPTLKTQIQQVQNDLESFQTKIDNKVDDYLQDAYGQAKQLAAKADANLQSGLAQKQDKGYYLKEGEKVTIRNGTFTDKDAQQCSTWLSSGCGAGYTQNGKTYVPALLDAQGPHQNHTIDHQWFIYKA